MKTRPGSNAAALAGAVLFAMAAYLLLALPGLVSDGASLAPAHPHPPLAAMDP